MARRKNPNPVRRHYSRDLKRRVIHQAYTLGHSSTEIAIHLDMPLRVVQRVRKVWSEIGEVCKDRTRMGRAPIMSSDSVKVNQTISHQQKWKNIIKVCKGIQCPPYLAIRTRMGTPLAV